MAKSPLSGPKNTRSSTTESIKKATVSDIDLKFELQQRNSTSSLLWNLRDWCHLKCIPSNALANPKRITRMQKLGRWIKEQKRSGTSELTIVTALFAFKRYITFCDNHSLSPFSKVGYLAYAGNAGELWRQIGLATTPNRYSFQYNDSQELGILESSAYQLKRNIDSVLLITGFDVSEFQATIQSFSQAKRDHLTGTQPYSSCEWGSLIRRTQYYFESLSEQLIEYKKQNPSSPPPQVLDQVIVDKVDGTNFVIKVGGKADSSPFNQCMCAGYTLFAYYTAFNDSVIQAIRHPLKTITGKKEGKTMTHVKVKAYKGRSDKEVQAMFTNLVEAEHPEATTDIGTGYIVADIDKRSIKGGDGLAFVETLRALSKAYSDDTYGCLIYNIDTNGRKKKTMIIHDSLAIMSQSLCLLSDDRVNLKDYLLECFTKLLENQQINFFKKAKNEVGSIIMSKKLTNISSSPRLTSMIPVLGIAVASCLTDIPLKNILMPLRYSDVDAEGNITIFFSYLNGKTGYFLVAHEYQYFFESLENYAQSKNPLPKLKRKGPVGKQPSFLFPLGSKQRTYQWEGTGLPIHRDFLLKIGIMHGDFYLSVTSGQIRTTHSDLEYTPNDGGLNARKILQHGEDAQASRYINGHPIVNIKQASQGMQGLENISGGLSRNQALEEVKKTLNIPIIAYEIWKARQTPTNPNGIACNGKIDLAEGKNRHYAAKKFAEKESILSENQEITCYQYDLCVFCKNAQLVDDPYSIYKLLSFIDAIKDSIDQFPERANFINEKVARFQLQIDGLPYETVEQAEVLFENHGRYPLFNSSDSIIQHL